MLKNTPQLLLSRWRREQGLSLRAAGDLLGCTYQAIYSYEEGRSTPRLDIAHRIAKVVGIPTLAWVK
jgi:DNA-binding XRE family transcriptional regulator